MGPGEPKATGAHIAAARRALGYRPRTSLVDGIAAQLAEVRAANGAIRL